VNDQHLALVQKKGAYVLMCAVPDFQISDSEPAPPIIAQLASTATRITTRAVHVVQPKSLITMRHLWGIAVYLSLVAAISSESSVHPFAVIGYLPEWRFEGANWDYLAATCTHLLLFSLEPTPDGRITALDRLPRPMLLEEARTAASKHDSRLLLCFGGNGRSSGFSAMARSASARQMFVASLVALIEEHGLHGVDYNVRAN